MPRALLQSRVVTQQFTSLSVSEFDDCVDPMEGKSYSVCLSVTVSFHHHVFQIAPYCSMSESVPSCVCIYSTLLLGVCLLRVLGTAVKKVAHVCVFKVLLNSLEYMPRNRVLDDKIILFPMCGGITIMISYCSPL